MNPLCLPFAVAVACSLGQGSRFGVTFMRAQWQGQLVFIKTLQSDDRDFCEAFHHEGEVASRLSHPRLLPLLAHSCKQLMFPWVDGLSLRDRLKVGPLEPLDALSVTAGLLEALVYLHANDTVHHDIKPENVMLVGASLSAEATRLTDLGMAYHPALPDVHAGTRMGTPQFMAPEQFYGVRGDPRSDLYAVGALLFDALAGCPPYPNALGWLVGLSSERLPLPGPKLVRELLASALQRDPAKRPQSAAEMLRQVREVTTQLRAKGPTDALGQVQVKAAVVDA